MKAIRSSVQRIFSRVVVAAAVMSTAGCAATVTTRGRASVIYDYPVVYVDAAPVRVYDSPRVTYHGRPAYLVDGRWYYESDRGWVYFEREPVELRRYRSARAAPERHYQPRRRYVEPREGQRRRYYD